MCKCMLWRTIASAARQTAWLSNCQKSCHDSGVHDARGVAANQLYLYNAGSSNALAARLSRSRSWFMMYPTSALSASGTLIAAPTAAVACVGQDVRDLHLLDSYHDQLYAAVCFSVINSIEKIFRYDFTLSWCQPSGHGASGDSAAQPCRS